jgi:hypothetical protein
MELRFTRSRQAVVFWISAAMLAAAAIILAVTSIHREANPQLPHPAWALAPLAASWISARLAMRLTRHAYLILTPLGVEIFPFFRPAAGMAMVPWQQVHTAEVNASHTRLTLHHNPQKTSGIHLSLAPIRSDRRALLVRALEGRGLLHHETREADA